VFRDYRPVFEHLDWTLERGEHWAVSGANGSGKSTLIALLYGDLSAAHGGLLRRDGLAQGQSIELWKQRVGLVSPELQATYAATSCTLRDLIVSGEHASIGLNRPATRAEQIRALRMARKFDLHELAERGPRELSYGQLRIALFARAFMRPRELLLLDEPFDGLDAHARAGVESHLQTLVAAGTQVVIATHHREDVPAYVTRELDLTARVTSRR
jgi:molybdate transport system ATP-binding protein